MDISWHKSGLTDVYPESCVVSRSESYISRIGVCVSVLDCLHR